MRRTLLITIIAATLPSLATAQAAKGRNSFFGINPLGIPWDVFQAELETGVGVGTTVGGVVSYTDIDDDRNRTIDLKLRYYPSEALFKKFSAGLSVGYTNFSRIVYSPSSFSGVRTELGAPTVGVVVDYNWLLGPSQRFVVGTGVGAKRILAAKSDRETMGLDRAYMTGRFIIGIAF